jgi:hypothetical protein
MVDLAETEFGGVDIFNNAGIQYVAAVEEFPIERPLIEKQIPTSSSCHRCPPQAAHTALSMRIHGHHLRDRPTDACCRSTRTA